MKNKKEDEKVVQFPSKNDAFDVNEQGDQNYAIGDEPIEQKEESTEGMPLPQPLEVLRFKQAITAVVIAALAVIMTIAARKLEPLLLLMPALYFLWMAWAVENDWEKGRIEQHVVACTQVQFLADSTRLVCRDEDTVYSYIVSGKKRDFIEGYSYIIWARKDNPRAVIAYLPI